MLPQVDSIFHFSRMAPELSVLLLTIFLLIVGTFVHHHSRSLCRFSYLCCNLVAFFSIVYFSIKLNQPTGFLWNGMYVSDSIVRITNIMLAILYILSLAYSHLSAEEKIRSDFYPLSLICLLGSFVMSSANHWLVLYLGLEIFSIALYTIIAFNHHVFAAEAAMKYFILGALASVFFLFGVSYFYGVIGNSYMHNQIFFHSVFFNYLLVSCAVLFIICAICFKLGVFPFHAWVPDVYSGASDVSLSFLTSFAKLGVAVFSARSLFHAFSDLRAIWHPIIAALALMTLFFGNVVAISQTKIKRLLAFSSIAQMGFIFLSFYAAYPEFGRNAPINLNFYQAFLFFVFSYSLSIASAIGLCLFLRHNDAPIVHLSDLSGLFHKKPRVAALATFSFFSLAGIPPFVGFWAKFFVLDALVRSEHFLLSAFAILFSVVGVFYYLRIIKVMFFDQPQEGSTWSISSPSTHVLWSCHSLLLFVLGIFSDPFVALLNQLLHSTGL